MKSLYLAYYDDVIHKPSVCSVFCPVFLELQTIILIIIAL